MNKDTYVETKEERYFKRCKEKGHIRVNPFIPSKHRESFLETGQVIREFSEGEVSNAEFEKRMRAISISIIRTQNAPPQQEIR